MKTFRGGAWSALGLSLGWAAAAVAETITIENGSQEDFSFSVRSGAGRPWSPPHVLGPHEGHQFTTAVPLEVSYWTDKPRFQTLQPNQTYRLRDARCGELLCRVETRRPALPDPLAPAPHEPQQKASGQDSAQLVPRAEASPAIAANQGRRTSPVREVRVLVLADVAYRRSVSDWRGRIRDAISFVSDYYESRFGVCFVITQIQAWDYEALSHDLEEREETLFRVAPADADLVVAFLGFGEYFTNSSGIQRTSQVGHASPFGRHLMVCSQQYVHSNRDKMILIHEFAHIFGAFHVAEKTAVLQPNYQSVPTEDIIRGRVELGEQASAILRRTRDFDFARGAESLSPEVVRQIQDAWRQHRHPGEKLDPIEMSRNYRQRLAALGVR